MFHRMTSPMAIAYITETKSSIERFARRVTIIYQESDTWKMHCISLFFSSQH